MILPIANTLVIFALSAAIYFWPRNGYFGFRIVFGFLAFVISCFVANLFGFSGAASFQPSASLAAGPADDLWSQFVHKLTSVFSQFVQSVRAFLRESSWGHLNDLTWLTSYGVGIAALAAYIALRTFAAGFVRLLRLENLTPRPPIFVNQGMAVFARSFAFAFFVIVAGGPFLVAYVHNAQFWEGFFSDWLSGIETMVWFGIYALVLELAGAFHRGDSADAAGRGDPERSGDPDDKDIAKLYKHLTETYPTCLLKAREPQTATSEVAGRDEQQSLSPSQDEEEYQSPRTVPLCNRLREDYGMRADVVSDLTTPLDRFVDGRGALIFDETLSASHYDIIAELCQVTTDSGGCSLIVCPDAIYDDITKTLSRLWDNASLTDMVNACFLGANVPSEEQLSNVIVCPLNLLQKELLEKSSEFEPEFRRLRLLVCLELQATDVAQLKLFLGRLRHFASRQFYVIAQVAERNDSTVLARTVFSASEIGDQPSTVALVKEKSASQHLIVWDHGKQTIDAIKGVLDFEVELGAETLPLVVLTSLFQDYDVFVFDPLGRRYVDGWGRLERHGAIQGMQPSKAPSGPHIGGGNSAQVIFVEDCGNLPAILFRNYNYRPGREILLNVICHDYPLRDFFVDQVRESGKDGNLTDFLPMSPDLSFGISELADQLLTKMIQTGGLPQRDLSSLFDLVGSPSLLTSLEVGLNLDGLKTLFSLVFGDKSPSIKIKEDNAKREHSFVVDPGQVARARSRGEMTVNKSGTHLDGFILSAADRGTTYAQDTMFKHDHTFYRISSLSRGKVNIQEIDPLASSWKARPTYVFDKRFTLLVSSDEKTKVSVFEGSPALRRLGDQRLVVSHLQSSFSRRTAGVWHLEEGQPPFLRGQTPARQKLEREYYSVERRFKSVMHLCALDSPRRAARNAEDKGKLAFTLCVIVNDTIASVFNQQAQWIATLSPQSKALFADTSDSLNLTRFLRERYGTLEEVTGDPVVEVGNVGSLDDRIDLYIIEDSDQDLGVVRAIFGGGGRRFFELCLKYAQWMREDWQERSRFYRFGAQDLPDLFDLDGAISLLSLFSARSLGKGPGNEHDESDNGSVNGDDPIGRSDEPPG